MLKEDGICYYCNIASPALINHKMIKYIDYDLDAKLFPSGDIRILDEKEYLRHKKLYNYSDDLDVVLKYQTKEIVKKMENHEWPFDDSRIKHYYDKFLETLNKDNK